MSYVIIGNGIAGWSAVEAIRSVDKRTEVILVSDEQVETYSRVLIPSCLSGHLSEQDLKLTNKIVTDQFVTQMLGYKVTKIVSSASLVILESGQEIPFDKLLLACGARAKQPGWPGQELPGVYNLRTIDDIRLIAERIKTRGPAVVAGGGFVSIKAATALNDLGLPVTIVVSSGQILSQAMDMEAAAILQRRLEAAGIMVRLYSDVKYVEKGPDGMTGVGLTDGTFLPCRLVVAGKGVTPNTTLAANAGIKVERGIVVDEYLRTSKENIYAAGDVAEAWDCVSEQLAVNAIWPNAKEQGWVAGRNMAGILQPYAGSLSYNLVQAGGWAGVNIGITRPTQGLEYVIYRSGDVYRKLILRDGILVGAILVGQVENAGLLYSLVRKKIDVSKWTRQLLDPDLNYGKLFALFKRM